MALATQELALAEPVILDPLLLLARKNDFSRVFRMAAWTPAEAAEFAVAKRIGLARALWATATSSVAWKRYSSPRDAPCDGSRCPQTHTLRLQLLLQLTQAPSPERRLHGAESSDVERRRALRCRRQKSRRRLRQRPQLLK